MLFCLEFIILSKRKVKFMKRKANSILLTCLCVLLAGLFSATVYAALQSTLNISNTISFTPSSDELYYKAYVEVRYKDSTSNQINASALDHDGMAHDVADQDDTTHTLNMGTVLEFTKEERTIVYKITVMNYTYDGELEVSFTLNNPEVTLPGSTTVVVQNSVNTAMSGAKNAQQNTIPLTQQGNTYSFRLDEFTQQHYDALTAPQVTFYIESTCVYFGKSFNQHNDFNFNLTKISN